MRTKITITIILFIIFATHSVGQTSENGETTVTFSDFSYINDITASHNIVYFATTAGIIRWEKTTGIWLDPLNDFSDFAYDRISHLWVDQFDKALYALKDNDYFEYDMLLEKWFPRTDRPQHELVYSRRNPPKIMYPPPQFNYSHEGYLFDPLGRNYQVNRIIEDLSGQWWMAFWGYGVGTSNNSSQAIDLLPYGLTQNRVDAIYYDQGDLLVGGSVLGQYRTGMTIFNPDKNDFLQLESGANFDFPDGDVYCFASDSSTIYVGTEFGLYLLDKSSHQVTNRFSSKSGLPDDHVYSLQTVGDTIFVGTEYGLAIIRKSSNKFQLVRPREFGNSRINDMATTDSSLWIASDIGAYQLLYRSGKLQKFQDPHQLVFSRALAVQRYGDNLWLGADDGLVKLNLKSGETKPFVNIQPAFNYRAMAVNDEIAVYSSDNGFTIIFDHDKKHPYEKEFSYQDGLPDNRVLSLLLDGDFLWIGTRLGLTRFWWSDPHRVD